VLPGDGRHRLDLARQQGPEDDLGAFGKRLPGRRGGAFGVPRLSLVISSMSGSVASNMASSPACFSAVPMRPVSPWPVSGRISATLAAVGDTCGSRGWTCGCGAPRPGNISPTAQPVSTSATSSMTAAVVRTCAHHARPASARLA
jgi:hypothetical protein